MRIGILGGTFDPIHKGHLALANAAVKQSKLDSLYFIPTYQHPLEQKGLSAPADDRFNMVELAIQDHPKFKVSDCEIKRQGISYTVDTLRYFREKFPMPNELFFITGGDWGKNLDQWKEINTIFKLAHFVVASRPGFNFQNVPKQVSMLDFIPLDISSTEVREQIKKGAILKDMIPENVLTYIKQHRLYQS